MNRNKSLIIIVFVSLLTLSSCVKAAKDIVDEIEQRAQCIEQLSEYTTGNSDKTCAQISSEIDNILRDCGEFFTQEEKDNLNAAKDNCTDN